MRGRGRLGGRCLWMCLLGLGGGGGRGLRRRGPFWRDFWVWRRVVVGRGMLIDGGGEKCGVEMAWRDFGDDERGFFWAVLSFNTDCWN